MKTCLLALCVLTVCSARLIAAPPEDAADVTASETLVDFTQLTTADALQLAYDVLLPGNHNYHGHRGRAMDEIASAAKAYGLDLTGRAKGNHEDQKKSDARLTLAQRILESARLRLIAEEQQAAIEH